MNIFYNLLLIIKNVWDDIVLKTKRITISRWILILISNKHFQHFHVNIKCENVTKGLIKCADIILVCTLNTMWMGWHGTLFTKRQEELEFQLNIKSRHLKMKINSELNIKYALLSTNWTLASKLSIAYFNIKMTARWLWQGIK